MRTKLANWKTKFLNIAGKTTLALSTFNAIPSHYMQYTSLPQNIIQQIDKIQRNFISVDIEEAKRLHFIGWNTITKPKEEGGLGLRTIKAKNTILLSHSIAPWANALITKYVSWKSMLTTFFVWKSILIG